MRSAISPLKHKRGRKGETPKKRMREKFPLGAVTSSGPHGPRFAPLQINNSLRMASEIIYRGPKKAHLRKRKQQTGRLHVREINASYN